MVWPPSFLLLAENVSIMQPQLAAHAKFEVFSAASYEAVGYRFLTARLPSISSFSHLKPDLRVPQARG